MTSYNELKKMIANAIIRDGQLDGQSSIGQASGGDLFIRRHDQVFQITVTEIEQISRHTNPVEEAERFMDTLPLRFDK